MSRNVQPAQSSIQHPLLQLERIDGMVKLQPTPLPRRQPKTNSERGRAFRERERERIERLEQEVAVLARVVAEKTFLRGIWQAKYLRSRHTKNGSLARLVEEYYAIVQHGVHDSSHAATGLANSSGSSNTSGPVEFLSRVTHPEAVLGDVVGPLGMIDQWKKFTAAFSRYETRLRDVNVCGPEDDPVVCAQLVVTVCFTRTTFETIFPYALRDATVAQRLLGREVSYQGVTSLRFSNDSQIVVQQAHFGFVQGLMAAGISLADVERLMRGCRLSPTSTLQDPSVLEQPNAAEVNRY